MTLVAGNDLITGVIGAANPLDAAKAAEKLKENNPLTSDALSHPFTVGLQKSLTVGPTPSLPQNNFPKSHIQETDAPHRFEATILKFFMETMLPDKIGGDSKSGISAGVWKSFLAEQLASSFAKRGGIGIADQIAKTSVMRAQQDISQFDKVTHDDHTTPIQSTPSTS